MSREDIPDNDVRPHAELAACCCCAVITTALIGFVIYISGVTDNDLFKKPRFVYTDDKHDMPSSKKGYGWQPGHAPLFTHTVRRDDSRRGVEGPIDSKQFITPKGPSPLQHHKAIPADHRQEVVVPLIPVAKTSPNFYNTTNKYGILHAAEYYPARTFNGLEAPPPAKPAIFCFVRQQASQGTAFPLAKPCTHFLIDMHLSQSAMGASKVISGRVKNVSVVALTREKFLLSPVYREDFKKHATKFKKLGYTHSGLFLLEPMADIAGRISAVCDVARNLEYDVVFLMTPTQPTVFTQPFIQEALYYSGKYIVVLLNRLNDHIGQRMMCDNPLDYGQSSKNEPPVRGIRKTIEEMPHIVWSNNTYVVPAISLRLSCFEFRKSLMGPPKEMTPSWPVGECASTGCPKLFSRHTPEDYRNVPIVSKDTDCTIYWRQSGVAFSGIGPDNVKAIQTIQQGFSSIALWFWDDWYHCFKTQSKSLLKAVVSSR